MKRPILLGISALATVLVAGTALAQPGADELEVTMTVAEPDAQVGSTQMDLQVEDAAGDVDDGQVDDVDDGNADDINDGNLDDVDDGEANDGDDGDANDGQKDDVDDGAVDDINE